MHLSGAQTRHLDPAELVQHPPRAVWKPVLTSARLGARTEGAGSRRGQYEPSAGRAAVSCHAWLDTPAAVRGRVTWVRRDGLLGVRVNGEAGDCAGREEYGIVLVSSNRTMFEWTDHRSTSKRTFLDLLCLSLGIYGTIPYLRRDS